VANYTGRYQVNNMFDGFFVLPDQAAVDLRLAAKPYRYNQRGDDVLYYDQIEWQPLPGAAVHLQPFAGLERLAEYADRAVRLPDEAVLGEPSTVLRFRFTQAELNDIMGVGDSGAAELPDRTDSEGAAARVPEDTQLTLLLWIGQTDGTL